MSASFCGECGRLIRSGRWLTMVVNGLLQRTMFCRRCVTRCDACKQIVKTVVPFYGMRVCTQCEADLEPSRPNVRKETVL